MAAKVGELERFTGVGGGIELYEERLEQHFIANLVAPEKPQDNTYDELLTIMRYHYCPKPSEALLRYKFYNQKQKPNKSCVGICVTVEKNGTM